MRMEGALEAQGTERPPRPWWRFWRSHGVAPTLVGTGRRFDGSAIGV
jgi:hypothetical protein